MLASYGSFMRVTRFIAPVAEQKSRGPSSSSSSSLLQSTVYVKNAGEKAAFNDVTRVPWSCRKKQKEKKKEKRYLHATGWERMNRCRGCSSLYPLNILERTMVEEGKRDEVQARIFCILYGHLVPRLVAACEASFCSCAVYNFCPEK